MGGADKNHDGFDDFGADLPAEPLYLHLSERVTGPPGGNLRAANRVAHVDDDPAHRVCAGGVDFFAIVGIRRLDGCVAPDILAGGDIFRTALPGSRLFAVGGEIARGVQYLGDHLFAGVHADDHGVATHHRPFGYFFADAETILSQPLG